MQLSFQGVIYGLTPVGFYNTVAGAKKKGSTHIRLVVTLPFPVLGSLPLPMQLRTTGGAR
jgi:hypothetical protein